MRKRKVRRLLIVLPLLALGVGGFAYQASNSVAPSYAGTSTVHITP
jgi:hypothetical protein